LNYFKTYYGGTQSGNFIPDDLLKEQFEETKTRNLINHNNHTQTFNNLYIENDQVKNLGIIIYIIINILLLDSNKNCQFLYCLDAEDETIDITLFEFSKAENEKNEDGLDTELIDINLINNEVLKLYFDTRVRGIMIPNETSAKFSRNNRNTIYFMDMYSVYFSNVELNQKNEIKTEVFDEMNEDNDDEIYLKNFKKIITLDQLNHFISNTMYDKFFVTSNNNITIFNEELMVENSSNQRNILDNCSKMKNIEKGIFFNHNDLIMLFNQDQVLLYDNRV